MKWKTKQTAYLLLAIILLSILLRFMFITSESLWSDEFITKNSASSMSLLDNIKSPDWGHPPLYYTLNYLWTRIFGVNDLSMRSLTAIIGVASVIVLFMLANRVAGTKIALLSAFLMAVSPLHVWDSQNVRNHSLFVFFTLVSTYLLVRAIEDDAWKQWIYYAISGTLLLYTHYFGGLVLLFHGCFYMYYISYGNQKIRGKHLKKKIRMQLASIKKFVVSVIGIIILFIPQLLMLQQAIGKIGLKTDEMYYLIKYFYVNLGVTPLVFSVGRSLVWQDDSIMLIGLAMLGVLVFFIIPFLKGIIDSKIKSRNLKKICREIIADRVKMLLLLWLIISIVLAALVTKIGYPVYAPHYMAMTTPAFLILLSKGLASMRKKVMAFFLIGILVLTSISLYNFYTITEKEEWKQAVAYVDSLAGDNDLIIIIDSHRAEPYAYYSERDISSIELPRAETDNVLGELKKAIEDRKESKESFWIMYSHSPTSENIFKEIEYYLEIENNIEVKSRKEFHKMTVFSVSV